MLADIEECKAMLKSIVPYEETDLIRWFRLKITVFNVKDFVEKASYMEAKSIFLLIGQHICVLVVEDPAAL